MFLVFWYSVWINVIMVVQQAEGMLFFACITE